LVFDRRAADRRRDRALRGPRGPFRGGARDAYREDAHACGGQGRSQCPHRSRQRILLRESAPAPPPGQRAWCQRGNYVSTRAGARQPASASSSSPICASVGAVTAPAERRARSSLSAQKPYTAIPALTAAATPEGVSSTTAHSPGATPSVAAACRNRSGWGLPRGTCSAEKRTSSAKYPASPVSASERAVLARLPCEATQLGTPELRTRSTSSAAPATGRSFASNTAARRSTYSSIQPSGSGRPSSASEMPTISASRCP